MGIVRRANAALLRSSIVRPQLQYATFTSRIRNIRAYSLLSISRRPKMPSCPGTIESPLSSIATPTSIIYPTKTHNPAIMSIQVRNHRRATYDPSHRVRKRRHGFLARLKSRTGRAVLARRKAKHRSKLSH